MAKMRLTQKGLEGLKPPASGQADYYDTGGPPGFLIRVSQGGTKTFQQLYRVNGVMKRWTVGRFPALSLAEARDKAKKRDANETDPVGEKKRAQAELERAETFKELAAKFFEANADRLKPRTRDEWKRIEEQELRPHFGTMRPQEITRGDIRAFLEAKAKTAPYMSNRILEVIRRIYSWGVEVERVAASPCVGLKKVGVEKQRERVLTTEELKKVFEALKKERPMIASFFRLALLTGARRGEILSVRWSDVDFDERLLTFPDTKNNAAHTIPLSEDAVKVLRELHPLAGHSEYVFMGPTGAAIQNPQKAVARVRKNSGVEFRIHDIRRSVATGIARLGVPREVISAILGHTIAGPQATRIYDRHSRIPEMRAALERWSRELERIQTGQSAKVVSIAGQ
jgi:integrase